MVLNVIRILVENIRGSIPEDSREYMKPKLAYRYLKHYTQQDFGYEADKWKLWFKEAEHPIRNPGPLPPEIDEDEDNEVRDHDNPF